MYENRKIKPITNCFKWGGEWMRKRNNGGGFYQSSLYAYMETSHGNHFAQLIYAYKKKRKNPATLGTKFSTHEPLGGPKSYPNYRSQGPGDRSGLCRDLR
jgi:hypothetical protein